MANTKGVTTRPTTTDDVYGVALKIARTIIETAKIKGHYSDFDKTPIEYGGIIEKLRVALKSSSTFDPNEANPLAPSYDTIIKRYFGTWDSKRFDTEVQNAYAKSILAGQADVADLVAKIVNNLNESELAEANDRYKALFMTEQTTATAITDRLLTIFANNTAAGAHLTTAAGLVSTNSFLYNAGQNCYEVLENPTVDEVLVEIRDVVKDMEYKNTTYQGVTTFPCETPMEDLRIVVPFRFLNKVDVTKLANLFNLDKASMLAKIVETDGCEFTYADATATTGQISAAHGYAVIITDVNAIGRVTKGREMETAFVKERFSQWYGERFDEMFYYDPLCKCYAIVFTDELTKVA